MSQVWNTGETKINGNFRTRLMLFNAIVRGLMLYGAKVWGWEKHVGVGQVQMMKYLKWMLGLESSTPNYVVFEGT